MQHERRLLAPGHLHSSGGLQLQRGLHWTHVRPARSDPRARPWSSHCLANGWRAQLVCVGVRCCVRPVGSTLPRCGGRLVWMWTAHFGARLHRVHGCPCVWRIRILTGAPLVQSARQRVYVRWGDCTRYVVQPSPCAVTGRPVCAVLSGECRRSHAAVYRGSQRSVVGRELADQGLRGIEPRQLHSRR